MGWYVKIYTDKEINPLDIGKIRDTFGMFDDNIGKPQSNVATVSGVLYSIKNAIPITKKMVLGLEHLGYKIIGLSGDEGWEEFLKVFGRVYGPDEEHPIINPNAPFQEIPPSERDPESSFVSDFRGETDTLGGTALGVEEPEGEEASEEVPKQHKPEQKLEKPLKSMDDAEIVKTTLQRIKDKNPLSSDEILAIYDIAKERKSNKLINLVKQLSQLLKEEKKAHMKTELMEYLVRACVREVLDQTQATPTNAINFYQDSQGMWCKECGNKGSLIKLPSGATAYSCNNTTCRAFRTLMRQGRLEEGQKRCSKCEDPFSPDHPEDDCCKSCEDAPSDSGHQIKVKPFVKGRGFTPKIKPDSLKIGEQDTGVPPPDQETGNVPPSPTEKPKDEPSGKPPKGEEPEGLPPSADLKGIKLVNPMDKSKLLDQGKALKLGNDATLERSLYKIASDMAGSNVKVALSTMRAVKDALKSPNVPLFLYFGKYDEASEEIFLMADKSWQVAKDSSLAPEALTGPAVGALSPDVFHPHRATDPELIKRAAAQSRGEFGSMTPRYGIDEKLRKVIRRAVNEILNKTI